MVGVFDEETKEYHLYITDISPEQLSAEEWRCSRARWSIELVFKELKRLYKLDAITSEEPIIIESLVLVAMLTLVVSHWPARMNCGGHCARTSTIRSPSASSSSFT